MAAELFLQFQNPFQQFCFPQTPKLDCNSSSKVQPESYEAFELDKKEASGEFQI